jgi:hypothetical protein
LHSSTPIAILPEGSKSSDVLHVKNEIKIEWNDDGE